MLKYVSNLALIVVTLTGCSNTIAPQLTPTSFPGVVGPTAVLPTAIPPTEIRPTNTLVMANPWTPTPVPTSTPLPSDSLALVTGVLNTETVVVVLEGDNINHTYAIRLLGIDAPNNNAAEPWGKVVYESLDDWLTGQIVRVVQDITITNENDELPRYVYLGDTFINLRLVEEGLARPAFQRPDILFQSDFEEAARGAQEAEIGIWGPDPTPTPAVPRIATITPTLTITSTSRLTITSVITGSPAITSSNTGP